MIDYHRRRTIRCVCYSFSSGETLEHIVIVLCVGPSLKKPGSSGAAIVS